MKRIKKMSFVFVATMLVATLLLSMTGCEWWKGKQEEPVYYGEPISYTVACAKLEGNTSGKKNMNGLVCSVEELKTLCGDHGYRFFNETYHPTEADASSLSTKFETEMGQKIRSYDEQYFQDKALIINFFLVTGYAASDERFVREIAANREDGILILVMGVKEYSYVDDAMGFWTFLIEVDKAELESISMLDIVYNGGEFLLGNNDLNNEE